VARPEEDLFHELARRLQGFQGHFFPMQDGYDLTGSLIGGDVSFGLGMFFRNSLAVSDIGGFFCTVRETVCAMATGVPVPAPRSMRSYAWGNPSVPL
jgi:hypothetical protein